MKHQQQQERAQKKVFVFFFLSAKMYRTLYRWGSGAGPKKTWKKADFFQKYCLFHLYFWERNWNNDWFLKKNRAFVENTSENCFMSVSKKIIWMIRYVPQQSLRLGVYLISPAVWGRVKKEGGGNQVRPQSVDNNLLF